MKLYLRRLQRSPGWLVVELLLALLLAWATIASNGLVATACESQLPAVEENTRPPHTETC